MNKKDENSKISVEKRMAEDGIKYCDNDYCLVGRFERFSKKFFTIMLADTEPLFFLADVNANEAREFRKYKVKELLVEIVIDCDDGRPKILNYWKKESVKGEDIVMELLLKEILRNG